jgi:hypothetical protein
MSQNNSRVFSSYRALGINSDHIPCVIRYNQKHQETYVVTSVGKAFHVYKVTIELFIFNFIYYLFNYKIKVLKSWFGKSK